MLQTIEAIVDKNGKIQLLETVQFSTSKRAIVTILEEKLPNEISDTALLSESALAKDWLNPEEDEAWSYLQLDQ